MATEYEVPSPHEHHLEHVAGHNHGSGDNFAGKIAISLAAITLLTRKDWLKKISYTAAGASVILGSLAAMHI